MAVALEADLVHMHKFLLNQKEMMSEKVFSDLMAAQVKVFTSRLEAAKLTAGEGANLSSVLMNGPWTHAQKGELGQALAKGLAGDLPTKGGRRPSQQMTSFPCYLTDSDLEHLQSDTHSLVKVEKLVQRCVSLSLHLPSTSAVKHIVSTADKHDILKAFTTKLRATIKHMPKSSTHLESYPAKPENLPQELYNAAYSDEKPSEKGVTMMGVQAHVVPYRDTHSMVRSAKPSGSSAMSSESFCMQIMHAVSKMMQGQGGCQDGLPGLEVFASKRKNKALANAPSATGESAGSKPALEDRKAEEHKKPQEEQPAEEQEQKGLFDLKLPEGKQPADPKDQLDAMVGTFNARSKARKIEREEEKDTRQTFFWRGGKVHRSDRASCWRVFLCAGDRNDKKVAFKGDCQAAFVRALRMIEEGQ
ncbi:unnamed protein product [Durusdinium trenchii]|uniref:Uncharacterized protein n=1 Tax=Durusdinium trenchii TaxID=1381693 RepID=A0ABP0MSE8_9DINO